MTVIKRKKVLFVQPRRCSTAEVDPTQIPISTPAITQAVVHNEQNDATTGQTTTSNAVACISRLPVLHRAPNLSYKWSLVRFKRRNELMLRHGGQISCNRYGGQYNMAQANFQIRLANILFTSEFATKIRDGYINGIAIYSLPLGIVLMELQKYLYIFDFCVSTFMLHMLFGYLMNAYPNGLQTTVYCAVDEATKKVVGLFYADHSNLSRQIMDAEETGGHLRKCLELTDVQDEDA